jgi:dCMP deaminase
VLVKGRRVRSTGYNGAPSGMAGCGSCPRRLSATTPLTNDYDSPGAVGQCVAVHAEVNAVLYAERADVVGSTVYVTRGPCDGCVKTCRAAGVAAIVWPADFGIAYQDLRPDCGDGRACRTR